MPGFKTFRQWLDDNQDIVALQTLGCLYCGDYMCDECHYELRKQYVLRKRQERDSWRAWHRGLRKSLRIVRGGVERE